MNSYRRNQGGYTIIEVVIVLTVSALLFASSVVAYNQQNRRTAFANSVNNFAQDIQDVLNDVENGFYPSGSNFTCTAPAAGGNPMIDTHVTSRQGTNTDCIFVGKAIQFAPAGTNSSALDVYTVVGRRIKGGSTDPVSVINDARTIGSPDILVDRKTLSAAVGVVSIRRHDNGNLLSGVAVLTNSLGSTIDTGLNARSSLAVVPNAGGVNGLNISGPLFLTKVTDMTTGDIDNATHGIDICLQENGGRTAVISLESGQSETIVNTHIDQSCS